MCPNTIIGHIVLFVKSFICLLYNNYEVRNLFVRIRNLREDNDLTQKEISEYLFCDQSLYSKYERGVREVPVSVIIKLAKFYHTSTDYILGLTDIKKPYK